MHNRLYKYLLDVLRCDVPQVSILGSLYFLIFVNDLRKATKLLDPKFIDDTSLFYSDKNIKVLFETVNKEQHYVDDWFIANKRALNVRNFKYPFFHKQNARDTIPLRLHPL